MEGWTAPAQNVVYADRAGNIGFQHVGVVPIRAAGNGTVPQRGDDPNAEWTGEIPWDDQPHSINPSVGHVVTANDRIVGDDFPYFISCEWMNGWRGERIRELICDRDDHTAIDQVDIQCDVTSLPGRELVDRVNELAPEPATSAGRRVKAALQSWDGVLSPRSDGAVAYRLMIRALQEQVYGFLGDLLPTFLGYSRTDVAGYWALFARSTPVLLRAMEADDRSLLALGVTAAADHADRLDGWEPTASWNECLARALDVAGVAYAGQSSDERRHPGSLPSAASPVPGKRRARHQLHRLRLQHPLGIVPGLAAVANIGPFAAPGDADTVWQMSAFNNPLNEHAMVGPSHRRVTDLADLDRSVAVLCGGQSGHPASPHYVDQVPMWRAGEVRPAPFTRAANERRSQFRQVLEPASER
jgi:penicillin amidase